MSMVGRVVAGSFLLFTMLATAANAADPVTSTLTVYRVAVAADGHESLVQASTAKPNDRLQYVTDVRNSGVSAVHGIKTTLPLPPGTEFIAGSQQPADGVLASVDGRTFAPLPLKRTVKMPDGTSHEELVPTSDYRFLTWTARDIPANDQLQVSARVMIAGITATP